MRITMMGCGTSTGVPVIGCGCSVCVSSHPRNRRLRTGLKIEIGGSTILVDTPTDLRQQALRFGLSRVDGVLYTHAHADHIFGLDDLRVFNFRQSSTIVCYGSPRTLAGLRHVFSYAFEEAGEGGGRPRLELVEVDAAFELAGVEVVPVPVLHGSLPVLGYRIGAFAYVTDCSEIPAPSLKLLEGLEVLVLDALRYRPHSTHLSLAEAIGVAERLAPGRTVFTHLSHDVDYERPEVELPPGVELGFDGLTFQLADPAGAPG